MDEMINDEAGKAAHDERMADMRVVARLRRDGAMALTKPMLRAMRVLGVACVVLAAAGVTGGVERAQAQQTPAAQDSAGLATQPQPQPLPQPVAIGDSTNAWFALQSSNREAAPTQPMLGAEAGLAYQRYLESFKTKIPASFTSATQGGSSGNPLHVDYTNANGTQN